MTKTDPNTGEIQSTHDRHPTWTMVQAAGSYQEKVAAGRKALDLVTLPDLARPVPLFFVDMPWASTEGAQEDIVARMLAAPTLEEGTSSPDKLAPLGDYVGKVLTIHDAVARPGTLEDAWGAYLSLDITVQGSEAHTVVNTSSLEVCAAVWRAIMESRLPLTGQVVLKGAPVKGRNQPIGFMVESPF